MDGFDQPLHLKSVCVDNTVHALHIDTTALSDGTYELIPESDGGDLEAQANTAVLTEARGPKF